MKNTNTNLKNKNNVCPSSIVCVDLKHTIVVLSLNSDVVLNSLRFSVLTLTSRLALFIAKEEV